MIWWHLIYWAITVGSALLALVFAIVICEDNPVVGVIAGVVMLAVIGAMAMAVYDDAFHDHPTFTLRTDRWACTGRHTEVTSTWISNGKGGGYNQVSSYTVCDQYSRIKA